MENQMEGRAMTSALFDAFARITTGTITTVLLVPLPGLYPMNEASKARYEVWKKQG
jgi:hypothetical protein